MVEDEVDVRDKEGCGAVEGQQTSVLCAHSLSSTVILEKQLL